jgi:hypothetical protein
MVIYLRDLSFASENMNALNTLVPYPDIIKKAHSLLKVRLTGLCDSQWCKSGMKLGVGLSLNLAPLSRLRAS